MKNVKLAILKTLIYADIFDYPLTLQEIYNWLVEVQARYDLFKKNIPKLFFIESINGYFYLKGRNEIVKLRKKREKWSEEKIKLTKKIIGILKYIPTIKMIGLTGTLAVKNAKKNDDLDLLIVSQTNMLWTTRFVTTILAELTGFRRHPKEKITNNKICLNMFIDEQYLSIPKSRRDLYTAHEVLQMIPVWEKENTYSKFLKNNLWVKQYLPNAYSQKTKRLDYKSLRSNNRIKSQSIISPLLHFLEITLKYCQLWYMKGKRTNEVITKGIIRFHPQDMRILILNKYFRSLRSFEKAIF